MLKKSNEVVDITQRPSPAVNSVKHSISGKHEKSIRVRNQIIYAPKMFCLFDVAYKII